MFKAGLRISWTRSVAYLVCIGIGLGYVFPLYWTIVTDLKRDEEIFLFPPTWLPASSQWGNFLAATQYIPFWRYMANTALVSGLTVVGTVVSCSLIAYGFSHIDWRGRDTVFLGCLATLMLPTQVTMIPLYIVFRRFGMVGTYLPLILPAFFSNALYVFLLRQFLLTIPAELSDAARIDGSSLLGIFLRIMLPLLKLALATVALFAFVATYRDFLGPLIYLTNQEQ